MSIRDKFRSASGRRFESYDCEELGCFRIQSLTELERMQIEFGKLDEDGKFSQAEAAKTTARLFVATIVNEDGEREFSEADVNWLSELDAAIADPLRDAINAHVNPPKEDAKKTRTQPAFVLRNAVGRPPRTH